MAATVPRKLLVASRADQLRVGDIAVVRGNPVRLDTVASTKRPGKHGHVKVTLSGLDVAHGGVVTDWLSYNGDVWLCRPDALWGPSSAVFADPARRVCGCLSEGRGGGGTAEATCAPELCREIADAIEADVAAEGVEVTVGRVAGIEGWEYESFTMGHDTGRGYLLASGKEVFYHGVLCVNKKEH